ncbi:MAG: multicopper oxidase domain-containing protein [Bdellovibrionales bacterium]|nr:multicopper oxidase domain-containing protein [Bdellovibrionales bacterium]
MKRLTTLFAFTVIAGFSQLALAKTVKYELVIENKPVNMSGKKSVDFALTVNGGIPAPTLEFTEGDDAEINVVNKLKNEEVSIHWHGILLPPEEDGVAYVNTPPIHAGTSRIFKFKIRQNGTFWYHSHTAVQEQKGIYGALIIHPKKKAIAYDKDLVLVLSDWSDENADQIVRNLRKDGDFYLYKKDSVRSYFGAIKAGGLKSHLSNEWQRMGGMDLSDVGYDAFLINGKRDSQALMAHPGERIRLRIINAAASSYFYVAMGVPMQVISADGVDVEPKMANELLMGMAETYDVLFTVPEHKNYEIRATVQDVTGFASAWVGLGEKVKAPDKPHPDLYASMDHGANGSGHEGHTGKDSHTGHSQHSDASTSMDHSGHGAHQATTQKTEASAQKDHSAHQGMSHEGHDQSAPVDHSQHSAHSGHMRGNAKPGTKAKETKAESKSPKASTRSDGPIDWSTQSDAQLRQNMAKRDFNKDAPIETMTADALVALEPTTLPKDAKVHDLKLVLGGDMERYVWHINGKAISQDRLILINRGEIVRFTFVNDTMMHHPMHLHGHFFRVINESGDKSPLKHTVDVPPHGTRTIEFYANEPGQWMLHCHNLYHMKAGMARVIRYNDFKLTPEMAKNDHHDPHLHEHLYTYTSLEAATNHAKGQFKLMRTWDELDVSVETASTEYKTFSFSKEWETEGDLVYRRWFSNYFNLFGGGTLYHEEGYGTVGVGYILPLLFETAVSVNHEGKLRFDIEKRFQWTKNVFSDAEFTWRPDWGGDRDTEFEISLMYGPSWYWSAGLMFTEKSAGVGAQIQF